MASVMEWLRTHIPHRHRFEVPRELREASHRAANESLLIRSEVMMAAGGFAEYQRRVRELRDTIAHVIARAAK